MTEEIYQVATIGNIRLNDAHRSKIVDDQMRRPVFDLDVLRTFVTGLELNSFAKAAGRLGRSTSAVSAQLKKLEEQIGTPVLLKSGRGLALTPMGESLLTHACRIYVMAFCASIGLYGLWTAYPAMPPRIRFLFVRPALCLGLPSDSQSPAKPLPLASTSPCRVCRGLSPLSGCALPGAP